MSVHVNKRICWFWTIRRLSKMINLGNWKSKLMLDLQKKNSHKETSFLLFINKSSCSKTNSTVSIIISFFTQTDCFNYIKILLRLNSTHLYVCGTYAFSPTCAYIVSVYIKQSLLLWHQMAYFEDIKICVTHCFMYWLPDISLLDSG